MNSGEKIELTNPRETVTYPKKIFHVSAWEEVSNKNIGYVFMLNPGPQGAEGPDVYFFRE